MNWYGFIIACGIVCCIVGAYFAAKHRGIEGDLVIDIIVIGLPMAIIFARLYYVIFDVINPNTHTKWDFLAIIGFRNGKFIGLEGLAIYGACIGAVLGSLIIALWKNRKKNPVEKRVSFTQILDLAFTFVILGQSIGRWGNFANQEAHGYKITDPSKMWFPLAVFVENDNAWYYATFFYESMWDIMTFAILAFMYCGKFKSFDGFNFACYCIIYGAGRVWIEGMRSDSLWLVPPTVVGSNGMPDVGGIRVSQLVSILIMIFGVVFIAVHIIRAKKAGKKIFIFVPRNKLSDEYFDYDKTKLAHPMPDIKFWKDRNKRDSDAEEIIVDKSGVAIRVKPEEDKNGSREESDISKKPDSDAKPLKDKTTKTDSGDKDSKKDAEDVYEDKWDE